MVFSPYYFYEGFGGSAPKTRSRGNALVGSWMTLYCKRRQLLFIIILDLISLSKLIPTEDNRLVIVLNSFK